MADQSLTLDHGPILEFNLSAHRGISCPIPHFSRLQRQTLLITLLRTNIMKFSVLVPIVASLLAQRSLGDKITHKDCVCMSNNYIGYLKEWTIHGRSTGLPNETTTLRRDEVFLRDDYIFPKKIGYRCNPGSSAPQDCARVPDISQYVSWERMTPYWLGKNCFERDGGQICVNSQYLKKCMGL